MTDTQEIVWGVPIAVDGKRPGFLRDDDRCLPHWEDEGWYDEKDGSAGDCVSGWSTVTAIRLPADHPHYRQPGKVTGGDLKVGDAHVKPTPQADTKPDVTARMIGAIRELAARDNGDGTVNLFEIRRTVQDAVEIVAMLPEPVDPVEAIVDELMRKDCTTRQAIEEAVHRGRELALAGETGK